MTKTTKANTLVTTPDSLYQDLQSRNGVLSRQAGTHTTYKPIPTNKIRKRLLLPKGYVPFNILINKVAYRLINISEATTTIADVTGREITVNRTDDDICSYDQGSQKLTKINRQGDAIEIPANTVYEKTLSKLMDLPLRDLISTGRVSMRCAGIGLFAWLESKFSKKNSHTLSQDSLSFLGRLCFTTLMSQSAGDLYTAEEFLTQYMQIDWDNIQGIEAKIKGLTAEQQAKYNPNDLF
jgi:hypothetical protein